MAKKESKLVKIEANVDFEITSDQEGVMRLWGLDFIAKNGKLTAEVSEDEAEAMKAAKRAK